MEYASDRFARTLPPRERLCEDPAIFGFAFVVATSYGPSIPRIRRFGATASDRFRSLHVLRISRIGPRFKLLPTECINPQDAKKRRMSLPSELCHSSVLAVYGIRSKRKLAHERFLLVLVPTDCGEHAGRLLPGFTDR